MNLNVKESLDEKNKSRRTFKHLKEKVSSEIFSLFKMTGKIFSRKSWGKEKAEVWSENEVSPMIPAPIIPDGEIENVVPEGGGTPLKINEDVVEKIKEIEEFLDDTSIDEEGKKEEKTDGNDITFVTAEGKKKKYSKKWLKAVRMEALYDDIRNDIRQKIEQNSEDIEERESGSEGQIFRVRINLNGIESYVVAMKLRMDNNIEDETKMLEKANDILAVSGIDVNERAKVPNCYWTIEAKGENYLIMEYVDGKTLYTLTLETIIKTLIEKVKNTPLRKFDEWAGDEMGVFEKDWEQKKKSELGKIDELLKVHISNIESNFRPVSHTNAGKEAIRQEIEKKKLQAHQDKEEVKGKYSKKGNNYKNTKSEHELKLKENYNRYLQIFNEYKEDLLKVRVDFERDSVAETRYVRLKEEYDQIRDRYKSIVKGGKYTIPVVPGIELKWDERYKATNLFLQWIVDKKNPVFSEEEAQDVKLRIKRTLDIFHKNHFYHRDLGENLRNLMFKWEDGKPIPYIIDYGHSIQSPDYKEGPSIKRDPQHGGNSSVPEVVYAKDEKILNYITSGSIPY